jgi:hypothetical protein
MNLLLNTNLIKEKNLNQFKSHINKETRRYTVSTKHR